ncbi:hypothetical protein [Thiomicrorhabdus sp.]|nr:hypothetical protein [Thiomicrorhabdus sp.]
MQKLQSDFALPVDSPNHRQICNHPAYLFWKMQSQLTKLGNKLNAQKRKH